MRAEEWQERSRAHAERADALTAGHRARKAAGERHAVEDFLFEYYNTRPSLLRRWHPGADVVLEPGAHGAPHAAWRWYRTDDGAVHLAPDEFVEAARGLGDVFDREVSDSGGLKLISRRDRHGHNSWMHNGVSFVGGRRDRSLSGHHAVRRWSMWAGRYRDATRPTEGRGWSSAPCA